MQSARFSSYFHVTTIPILAAPVEPFWPAHNSNKVATNSVCCLPRRFAAYGATKRGLAQFTKSLQAELKLLDIKNVTVHNLSPGMVTTDLLMAGADRWAGCLFSYDSRCLLFSFLHDLEKSAQEHPRVASGGIDCGPSK